MADITSWTFVPLKYEWKRSTACDRERYGLTKANGKILGLRDDSWRARRNVYNQQGDLARHRAGWIAYDHVVWASLRRLNSGKNERGTKRASNRRAGC